MKKIFKYPLSVEDIQTIKLPKRYEILTVQLQNDEPVLYALVDETAEDVECEIGCVMTGQKMTGQKTKCEWFNYISTVQLRNGFVLHFFRIK